MVRRPTDRERGSTLLGARSSAGALGAPRGTPITFLGLPPLDWAIVGLLTALITIVGRLPERRATARDSRTRKG